MEEEGSGSSSVLHNNNIFNCEQASDITTESSMLLLQNEQRTEQSTNTPLHAGLVPQGAQAYQCLSMPACRGVRRGVYVPILSPTSSQS
eukprot:CAMPEP_0198109874 /NCGR_PEP_ID=MMETSP1442-20131203/1922_1 /TAXON_ID= /ORGANISM="Craspedostauros australis, Strain CCMP3328" /LENGTH=88 /DNA_ID=CAMNT_0043765709 /DNA_START=48 /DNA_END=311 /DNA_ORIENTATION=-